MTAQKNTQPNVAANAPKGLELSEAEQVKARGEGAKEAVKEAAKDSYISLTDGVQPGEPTTNRWHGSDEIMRYSETLELGVTEFEKLVADKDGRLADEKVYGLLTLERNGQNRTPYVRAMMKRLGISKDELPGGGPDYTNDVTAITAL